MDKTLSALSGALLAIGVVLLGACGGDALPNLTSASPLVDFGEIALGESGDATLRVANVGTAEAEIGLPTISGDDAAAQEHIEAGMKLHAKYAADGEFYPAEVVQVQRTPNGG